MPLHFDVYVMMLFADTLRDIDAFSYAMTFILSIVDCCSRRH